MAKKIKTRNKKRPCPIICMCLIYLYTILWELLYWISIFSIFCVLNNRDWIIIIIFKHLELCTCLCLFLCLLFGVLISCFVPTTSRLQNKHFPLCKRLFCFLLALFFLKSISCNNVTLWLSVNVTNTAFSSGNLELSAKCFQDLILKDQNHPAALINFAAFLLCKYGSVIPGMSWFSNLIIWFRSLLFVSFVPSWNFCKEIVTSFILLLICMGRFCFWFAIIT